MSSIKRPAETGGEPAPGWRGADPAAADGIRGFEARLLSQLQVVVTERAAAGQDACQRVDGGSAGPVWPRRLT